MQSFFSSLQLPPTPSYSPDVERNRFSGGSSDCDSPDGSVRASRDSGIYSSPSPPDEHHVCLSQVHLMQLKQYLLSKKPDEISLAISHEHAKILHFLEPNEKLECKAKNGLRLILLPSGSSLRRELIERCSLLRFTCLLSILSGSRRDAHVILKKWILTAVSLARHGDAFACSCMAGALSEKPLECVQWFWTLLDAETKKELEMMRNINKSLMKGERLEHHNHTTIIPFLQPILEIMSGSDSNYVDDTSFATEVESLWKWLDRARHWWHGSRRLM
ncbi:hypothetical protein KIN20_014222 [Parelaphostrongylus tenuis]|uniref:Ras-GEF domain-containing protein n=1 Tax=Parelaphostrongylus tenuis TaxID=148309 RepID=A0AAD5N2Y7_PARTN|nr:hypothetical protein KIN20_014222 [Parelaphostrongylus tenuis]